MPLPIQDAAALAATVNVHAGELAGDAMGAITVLAGMLGRMFLPFMSADAKLQRLLVMFLSALALGLWCREAEVKVIGHGFTIITSFCVVALATLGTFSLTDPANYTKENLSAMAHSVTLGRAGTQAPPTPPSV